jgi:transcriptional regulator with XRE-family HTH domain
MKYRRFKDLREDRDLTQKQVADMLFINRRTYSAYETGSNSMTPETLIKLADIYNVSIDYLLERTNNPELNK